jgi:CubicO group peptidase (beta-lactamase class C family)
MRFAYAFALLLTCLPASAESLNPLITAALAGTRTPAMGALVIRDGRITDEGAHGIRRNDSPHAVRLDDVWHIGSDGKPMTATLIAKLVDRGALSWNATLAQLLPDLADKMRPEYRTVTLADLLRHRGGFAHDTTDMKFFKTFFTDKRPLPAQRLSYVTQAVTEPPAVPPGTTFSYSNTGFILAAVIAERATGVSFEDLMRQELFQPLGMTSAAFGTTREGQNSGHHDGKPALPEDANPAMFAPAGNMYMTLRDWAKFGIDQMAGPHGRGRLLKPSTYQMMQTALPGTANGLGWGVADSVLGRKGPVLTHAGSDGNWYALVVLFPQTGNGALVAANAADDMGGDKAAKAVLQALLPTLAPEK